MATFADLTAKLNLNIANFASNMQKASSQANKFAANLQGKINSGMFEPTKKAKFEFKDVARIVQGILISKAFYGGLNAIRSATDAVWSFSQQLEYAQMVYSNLFGSTALASEFINVLKDFAAVTPFAFSDAEAAAKRLLAYGIKYQNVMYVMQGVLAASTAQQNPAIIESVSRAMGQIYTKGRLMNEEMRQLAEAGIPAYEILREKLGLTQKQLQNLGDEAIPASTAINALVEGINEKFGGVLKQSSKTMTGLISNIKDNALMLISGVFTPLVNKIRGVLVTVESFVSSLRSIYDLKGLGGVFEKLIPPEMHEAVRTLIVNFMNLWAIIKSLIGSVFNFVKALLAGLIPVLNALLPIINAVLGVMAGLLQAITSNQKLMKGLVAVILACAAAWAIYKLQALAAAATTFVIKAITMAVRGLAIALNFIVAHPVWALLALGIGLFVGLTGASDKFAASIRKLFGNLTSLGKVDPSKILMPESKKRAADLNKFNDALSGTNDAMSDLASSTGNAAKAAKGLLGFDEVFSLKSPDTTDVGGIATDIDDLVSGLDGLGSDLDLSNLWGDTDFGTVAQDFVNNLLQSLGGKEKLLSAGIGALLGGALGLIIGGPIGAKIGAAIGAFAGWFWPEVAKALGLTDVGTIALPIATVLGAAIGFLIGGPLGAAIGAGIGTLVGWIVDKITKGFETSDWTGVGLPIGIGIGAGIGFLVGGPLGALVGGAIGALVGWIVDMFIDGFTNGDWNPQALGGALGGGIGAAIGMCVGGPIGAAIGAAIGALIGWIVGLIVDNWDAITGWFANVGKSIGDFFSYVGKFFSDGFSNIGGWLSDTYSLISTKVSEFFAPVKKVFDDIKGAISQVMSDILSAITVVWDDIKTAVSTVLTDIWTSVSIIWNDIKNAVSTVLGTIFETVSNIFGFIFDLIAKVLGDIQAKVSEVFGNIASIIGEKVSVAFNTIKDLFGKIWSTISEKVSAALNTVREVFQSIWNVIKEKLSGAWGSVKEFFGGMYNSVKEKISNMYTSVKEGIGNIYNTFKNWISNLWDNVFGKFFGWINDGIKKLREFFGLDEKAKSTDTGYTDTGDIVPKTGHALGGIFNREHVARFAEGNKAEMSIPLENNAAMQPFVDAISNGIVSSLMPAMAAITGSSTSSEQLPPLYVGTLVADERGLKELYRKFQVIEVQESARRG